MLLSRHVEVRGILDFRGSSNSLLSCKQRNTLGAGVSRATVGPIGGHSGEDRWQYVHVNLVRLHIQLVMTVSKFKLIRMTAHSHGIAMREEFEDGLDLFRSEAGRSTWPT